MKRICLGEHQLFFVLYIRLSLTPNMFDEIRQCFLITQYKIESWFRPFPLHLIKYLFVVRFVLCIELHWLKKRVC